MDTLIGLGYFISVFFSMKWLIHDSKTWTRSWEIRDWIGLITIAIVPVMNIVLTWRMRKK